MVEAPRLKLGIGGIQSSSLGLQSAFGVPFVFASVSHSSLASRSPSITASSHAFSIASQSNPLCSKKRESSPASTARCRWGEICSIGVQTMNLRCSRPSARASDSRYSIIDVVTGFSVRRFEILGNVTSSYISQSPTAPTNIRNKILVQYHINQRTMENG